jgi:hypothetical protein
MKLHDWSDDSTLELFWNIKVFEDLVYNVNYNRYNFISSIFKVLGTYSITLKITEALQWPTLYLPLWKVY